MQEIRVKYGDVEEISKACGCHKNHVRSCLKGTVNPERSEYAMKVREMAIQMGGEFIKVVKPKNR